MCDQPATPPADLPPHIVHLARQIAHQCATPGDYNIALNVPSRPHDPMRATIVREDKLRVMEIER